MHSGGWKIKWQIRIATLLALCVLVAYARAQAAKNPKLGARIDHLLMTAIEEDKTDPSIHAEGRKIFADYGVPTKAFVGEQAAEEFVVLISHEPPDFLEQVLPKLARTTRAGQISPNSYAYLEACMRQERVQAKYPNPANPQLRDEIEKLIKIDQAPRMGPGFDPKKWAAIDKTDGTEERGMFAKYGMPTYSMVGPQAAGDFVTLVLHQPVSFMRQVLPKLKTNVEAGQADPSKYAGLYDTLRAAEKKPQFYGTRFKITCSPRQTFHAYPIADPANLNKRRAEIGLIPMFLYIKLIGKTLPNDFCSKLTAPTKAESRKENGSIRK